MTTRERRLAGLLLGVIAALGTGILWIRTHGGATGAPCADSYSCRGFLFGGAECVDVEGGAYCTTYCKADAG